MASNAQTANFFDGGSFEEAPMAKVLRPARTVAEIEEEERRRIAANYARGLDANGNPLPAYGTPGVSTMYQARGGTGVSSTSFKPGAGGTQLPGVSNRAGGTAQEGYFTPAGDFVAGRDPDIYMGGTGGDQAIGRGLADDVLGQRPTVDADHQLTRANLDRLTPVIDPNLARNPEIDRAFDMSSDLVDRILGTPLQTQQIADRVLSNQLAIGRSSPGGIGNVQAGVKAAMGAAPELQRDAAQQSIAEQQSRFNAASNAANIYAGVAAGTADRSVRIAEANTAAATNVMQNLTTLTGFDYQFDTAKMQSIGQLVRDFFNNAQVYAGLSTQEQIAQWDDLTRRYGIDQNFKAEMARIAASENIGPLDAMKLVLGGVSGAGGLGARL